jgi:hypothetical protein
VVVDGAVNVDATVIVDALALVLAPRERRRRSGLNGRSGWTGDVAADRMAA